MADEGSPRERQVGLALPSPLSGRLDALLLQARGAGARTTRKELVAALLHATDGSGLPEEIRRVRVSNASDAVVDGQDPAIVFKARTARGPRPAGLMYFTDPVLEVVDDQVHPAVPLRLVPVLRVGLALPAWLDKKLGELVQRVERSGERTTRTEVVEALILAAPTEGEALDELITKLRRRSARKS